MNPEQWKTIGKEVPQEVQVCLSAPRELGLPEDISVEKTATC